MVPSGNHMRERTGVGCLASGTENAEALLLSEISVLVLLSKACSKFTSASGSWVRHIDG
jgi:hypothetical protein